jgi:hypothetical protein
MNVIYRAKGPETDSYRGSTHKFQNPTETNDQKTNTTGRKHNVTIQYSKDHNDYHEEI